jgi:hypothetical protein
VERGECSVIHLLLYAKLGIWGASNKIDKGGMLRYTETGGERHPSQDGDCEVGAKEGGIRYKTIWMPRSDTPSGTEGQHQTTVSDWVFEVRRHNRRAHANVVRIHATGMRVQVQPAATGLQELRGAATEQKLDNRGVGSHFNMQGHSKDKRIMGTKGEQKERPRNNGALNSIRNIHR